jgi:hypothetical protein
MKTRLTLVALLVLIAAVAGIVRSYTSRGVALRDLPHALASDEQSKGEVREEIRESYELAPGARVLVKGINGAVKIETADIKTAEVHIERLGKSDAALARRKIVIESTPNSLEIRGRKGDAGFFARIFGSNPTERVTLRVPRQIALTTEGVNGAVIIGEIEGPVDVRGVNGKVEVAQAKGSAQFHGINGNIVVALSQIDPNGIALKGVNGNIEVKLAPGLSAEVEARGMNGRIVSDLPDFVVDEAKHGNYSARVGTGGGEISAKGINGNIVLSRSIVPVAVSVH